MKLQVVGRGTEVPRAFEQVAPKRLSKLDKFFPQDAEATIKLKTRRSSGEDVVELTVQSAALTVRAEKTAESYQSALDEAVDAIVRQIRKNKTRLERRLRDGAFKEDAAEAGTPLPEEESGETPIRYKSFRFKPMSPEEATLQMQLLGHSFYVFENDATGEVNVVYARRDGGFGCIEPGDHRE